MRRYLKHIFRFILLTIIQVFVIDKLPLADGISPQIYVLFLFGLPFEIKTIPLMVVAFLGGFFVDVLGGTYGMHTSALLVIAILRPIVFQLFSPREGYDLIKEPSVADYGLKWYVSIAGILTFVFHFYFFTLELFSWIFWKEIVLYAIISTLIALFLILLIQYTFLRKQSMS